MLATVEPEKIRLELPRQCTIYISLGTARDLLNELQRIFTQRVKDGKGLL